MFYADGEGVEELDIETELAPLRDVYGLMGEASHALVARFNALPVRPCTVSCCPAIRSSTLHQPA
jgi:hypothetical protein